MISIEELKQKYPVKDVAPYGSCIVIPGADFNPDWEGDVEEQTEDVMIEGEPVTLIILGSEAESVPEKEEAEGQERPVYSPRNERKPELSHGSMAEFQWSDEEEKKLLMPEFPGRSGLALRQRHVPWNDKDDELLVKLWKKRKTVSAIAEKVPGRSYESVKMRLQALKKLKRIEPRWKQKAEKEPKGPEGLEPATLKGTPDLKTDTPVHEPISTPTHTPLSLPDPAVKLLADILFLLQKQNITLIMQGLEIKELKGQVKIPDSIYVAYGDALLEDDKDLWDLFRGKVRKLLEASE
jgi:hypothetical protein